MTAKGQKQINPKGWKPGAKGKFKKEYCQKVIDVLKIGRNLKGFCYDIGIGERTVYDWINNIPDFAEAYAIAKAANEDYWVNLAAQRASQGSDALIKFMLSSCHGYREKTDVVSDITATVSSKIELDWVSDKP